MNNKNDILNELKTLAPTLAGVEKINCFKIPGNYFSHKMPKVSAVSNILDEQVAHTSKDFVYLDLMSEILADSFSHLKEAKVFKVPNDYFENLTEDVVDYKNAALAIDDIENSIAFDETFQVNNYAVPQNYFNNLSQNILNKINDERNAHLSDELVSQLNDTAFSLPENYFEHLSQSILNKIKQPEKSTKIISLQKIRNVLAIAATLAVFIAGAWFLNSGETASTLSVNDQIMQLSVNDIEAYIASNAYEFENELLAEDLNDEDSDNDLFWQMDLDADELYYYLQNINEYNLNI